MKLIVQSESSVGRIVIQSMHPGKGMYSTIVKVFIWSYSRFLIRYRYDGLYRVEEVRKL